MQLNLVLCPIDFSEFSTRAYQYALSLAEHYRAKLVALHIVELWRYPFADYAGCEADFSAFCKALKEGGEQQLREFVNKYPHEGIQPELVVKMGNASDLILSFAQEQRMELIVMGTHGRRGFDRLVLGSTTDRVMRRSSCPVLVISKQPHDGGGTDHVHRLKQIVYCTDFSHHSERALNYAISATEEYEAELTLLHVVEHVPRSSNPEDLVATCSERLDKLIESQERKALKVRMLVRTGRPYEQIAQYALEAQIDMVVMAARGADALERAVFGSTTYRVTQLGPCPVLVVHT